MCEFVRVGASSRELAGVRARSITSTRCCSTYGHFAQPMDILLNLWTFCSTYGHSAPPIDTLLDLWTMCGPNRWPGAPDPTGGRPLAAGGAPQDALARRSGRTPWRFRNRWPNVPAARASARGLGGTGRIDGREHRTPQVGALWPPAGPPRTPVLFRNGAPRFGGGRPCPPPPFVGSLAFRRFPFGWPFERPFERPFELPVNCP